MQLEQGICSTSRTNGWTQRFTVAAAMVVALSTLPAPVFAQTSGGSTAGQKAANTVTIHLDPDAATVRFTLKSFLHNAHGTFRLKGGDVVTNPATGLAQGEVLIDAGSASTGDAGRDAKWQKETLDSATYPAIIFHPVKVEGLKSGDGTQSVKASGMLTLKGQDHPLTMTLTLTTSGKHVSVSTHFTIPYVQWGLKEPNTGLIRYNKQIEMNVEAKGVLKNETARPSGPPASDSQ